MSKTRLLLISGGSLVGQNVLDTLSQRRQQIELIATNSVAFGGWLFDFDAVYLIPPTVERFEARQSRLLKILKLEQPDLVIPCRDDDVVLLADLKERCPDIGNILLCGNATTARIVGDKWLSYQFAALHGLPFVPTLATPADQALEAFVEEHGFPLLIKPRKGYGSRGVRLVFDWNQLCRAATQDSQVIQKYLGDGAMLETYLCEVESLGLPLFHSFEGLKYSIQIWLARDGSIIGNFCSRNVNRFGTSLRLECYLGNDAIDLGTACARAFALVGWQGPMNIQCQKTLDGRLFIYEFNGRISGATAARYCMGYDELSLAIQLFTDKIMPETQRTHGISDQVNRRAVDYPIVSNNSNVLARDGYWQRHDRGIFFDGKSNSNTL